MIIVIAVAVSVAIAIVIVTFSSEILRNQRFSMFSSFGNIKKFVSSFKFIVIYQQYQPSRTI